MAGVDSFGAIKGDIERTLEHQLNTLVEGELTIGRASALLGTIRAIHGITRQIAEIARRGSHLDVLRESVETRLPMVKDTNEANKLRDTLAQLAAQQESLAAHHQSLAEHLEKLEAALRT